MKWSAVFLAIIYMIMSIFDSSKSPVDFWEICVAVCIGVFMVLVGIEDLFKKYLRKGK